MNAHHSKNKWLTYSSQCNSKSRMSSCSRTGAVLPEPIQMALCSCSCPNCQTLERWHERLGLTAALLAFREQRILQSHLWHPVLIREEPVHTKHMSLGTHRFFCWVSDLAVLNMCTGLRAYLPDHMLVLWVPCGTWLCTSCGWNIWGNSERWCTTYQELTVALIQEETEVPFETFHHLRAQML